jgi:hypothetical protein
MKSHNIPWGVINPGSLLLSASLLFMASAHSQTVTFALIDIGATGGRPEPYAVGEQVGGADKAPQNNKLPNLVW